MTSKSLLLTALIKLRSEVDDFKKAGAIPDIFATTTSPRFGICFNVGVIVKGLTEIRTLDDIVEERCLMHIIFKEWEHYSGVLAYPVKGVNGEDSETAYENTNNMWVGEYGQLRIELLDHMIETLQNELA